MQQHWRRIVLTVICWGFTQCCVCQEKPEARTCRCWVGRWQHCNYHSVMLGLVESNGFKDTHTRARCRKALPPTNHYRFSLPDNVSWGAGCWGCHSSSRLHGHSKHEPLNVLRYIPLQSSLQGIIQFCASRISTLSTLQHLSDKCVQCVYNIAGVVSFGLLLLCLKLLWGVKMTC